ncbi:MAG: hypothetical protein RJA22_2697 [Verrucomicrobiota bacterium]|jgi:SAM-dependent methyltransferase
MNPAAPQTGPASAGDSAYYQRVADYYDIDSRNFEERSQQNRVLQRLREEFRRESEPHARGNLLEIGYGPGFDLLHWARTRPEATVHGLDISPGMQACAQRNVDAEGLTNVRAAVGTVEDIPARFPGMRFDFVYCYFGALNTTADLPRAAAGLAACLAPDGAAVLTFVNRWYLLEILYGLARLRWRKALARLRPVWGGYANDRVLESRCFSPRDIRDAFGPHFEIVRQRGYCLLYPAWYRNPRWIRGRPGLAERLWRADRLLNRTGLWSTGEYALYVLRPRRAGR